MTLIGFSLSSVRLGSILRGSRNAALALAMAAVPALASASEKTDDAFLRIEQVSDRLSSMLLVLENVAKAATNRGNAETAKTVPLLEPAVRAAFDPKSMLEEISDGLAEVDDGELDPAALIKAAAAFEDGRRKIADMHQSQYQAAAKEIEARVAGTEDGSRIRELADLMASPELAVETALTAQVMYASLEAFSNANSVELAAASPEKMKSEMQGVVASLRGRTENEKPMPKDVARIEEKARLTFILATLPKDDLSTLVDFYQSAEGKAKKQALVESYRDVSNRANTGLLTGYFSALSAYFKSNPRSQQQN